MYSPYPCSCLYTACTPLQLCLSSRKLKVMPAPARLTRQDIDLYISRNIMHDAPTQCSGITTINGCSVCGAQTREMPHVRPTPMYSSDPHAAGRLFNHIHQSEEWTEEDLRRLGHLQMFSVLLFAEQVIEVHKMIVRRERREAGRR